MNSPSRIAVLTVLAVSACGSKPETMSRFELDADTTQTAQFYALPYPSDLRLDEGGHPLLSGWPNPDDNVEIAGLITSAASRTRWPVLAVGYIDFDAPLSPRVLTDAIATDPSAPILLVDLSGTPPTRGRLTPVWATTNGPADDYLPQTTLAIAARPGFVLAPSRQYAFVVRRGLDDTNGKRLGVPRDLSTLAHGGTPSAMNGAAAKTLYAPLWPVLSELGIDADDVAAATVVTTDDAVAETGKITDAVLASTSVTIEGLALVPVATATDPGFCELTGTVSFPQYQAGKPPFDTDGALVFDASGNPVVQRMESADVVITIPKTLMPAAGYPLVQFFHGSGGTPSQIADAEATGDAPNQAISVGTGPASILGPEGIAMAASSLPVNPQRLPGATDYAYFNEQNISATRDIFRQGVIEQRLFNAALRKLQIPPSLLAGCTGPTLPATATAFQFDAANVYAQGQSMGGMYTNMIAAVEPAIKAAVPTGAGGFWGYFILETSFVPNASQLLGALFDINAVSFVHPVLALFETQVEPSDPLVSTPRLHENPLAGSPARGVYEPVGYDDEYFPTTIYDAMALGYDHVEAGDEVWTTMQDALTEDGRGGIVTYPISQNRPSLTGVKATGAVVQYMGDGVSNSHYIYVTLDAVKYQYRCFFASAVTTGVPTIYAPAALTSACP
jgi:hypothetical protein